MARNRADFTLTSGAGRRTRCEGRRRRTRALFADPSGFDAWAVRWRERLAREPERESRRQIMQATNPRYIPRNHRVEAMIAAATGAADFGPFEGFSR